MTENMPAAELIAERVADVRAQIGERTDRDVTLVAVTKRFDPAVAVSALAAGVTDLGESYAQELATKAQHPDLAAALVRWHFVGGLQTNKIRTVADAVFLWHSVDRLKVAREIAKRSPDAEVLAQVNVVKTEGQSGCDPAELPELVSAMGSLGLQVTGLMAIGANGAPEATRQGFRLLRSLADDLGLVHCSMGMSQDWQMAVDEGATMIRLGSTLFGPRPS